MTAAFVGCLGTPFTAWAATFEVISADGRDDGICDLSHCSLAEAIRVANLDDTHDTIRFAIPGAPNPLLIGPFPTLTTSMTIDGATAGGSVVVDNIFHNSSPIIGVLASTGTIDVALSNIVFRNNNDTAPSVIVRGRVAMAIDHCHFTQVGEVAAVVVGWALNSQDGSTGVFANLPEDPNEGFGQLTFEENTFLAPTRRGVLVGNRWGYAAFVSNTQLVGAPSLIEIRAGNILLERNIVHRSATTAGYLLSTSGDVEIRDNQFGLSEDGWRPDTAYLTSTAYVLWFTGNRMSGRIDVQSPGEHAVFIDNEQFGWAGQTCAQETRPPLAPLRFTVRGGANVQGLHGCWADVVLRDGNYSVSDIVLQGTNSDNGLQPSSLQIRDGFEATVEHLTMRGRLSISGASSVQISDVSLYGLGSPEGASGIDVHAGTATITRAFIQGCSVGLAVDGYVSVRELRALGCVVGLRSYSLHYVGELQLRDSRFTGCGRAEDNNGLRHYAVLVENAALLSNNLFEENGHGIGIVGAGTATIGNPGDASLLPNRFLHNEGNGIVVQNGGRALIGQNSWVGNGELAISLTNQNYLPTLNDRGDTDTGPNGRLNSPVITGVTWDATGAWVRGLVTAGLRLNFYRSATRDISGFGEGETFLASLVEGGPNDMLQGVLDYSDVRVGTDRMAARFLMHVDSADRGHLSVFATDDNARVSSEFGGYLADCIDTETSSSSTPDESCTLTQPYCDVERVPAASCAACLVDAHCAHNLRGSSCMTGGCGCRSRRDCATGLICFSGACESPDSDGDRITNALDLDDDNDGLLDMVEGRGTDYSLDSDGDGVIDAYDTDRPGFVDGDANGTDDRTDLDGDRAPNFLDLDSDNDRSFDLHEAGLEDHDIDVDGRLDVFDDDGNGVSPVVDPLENGNVPMPADSDSDGNPDFLDPDDDGDGVFSRFEVGIGVPLDTDGDGVLNRLDQDDDGDHLATALEGVTLEGQASDRARNTDTDNRPDYLDADDDDDGIPTTREIRDGSPIDRDGDGVFNHLDNDDDNDGIATLLEGQDSRGPSGEDPDLDGSPSWNDEDSDGDSVSDRIEGRADLDRDEIPNYLDADSAPGSPPPMRATGCVIAPYNPDVHLLYAGVLLAAALRRRRLRAVLREHASTAKTERHARTTKYSCDCSRPPSTHATSSTSKSDVLVRTRSVV